MQPKAFLKWPGFTNLWNLEMSANKTIGILLLLVGLCACQTTASKTGTTQQNMSTASLIAHRGNSSEAPENTLAAVRSAMSLPHPPEYIEIDVHRSADGTVVVIHDADLQRTTGVKGSVRKMQWSEIRKHQAGYAEKFGDRFADAAIPCLGDVLEATSESMIGVMIEIKQRGIGGQIAETLTARKENHKHILASFYPDVLVHAHMAHPDSRLMFLSDAFGIEHIELARRIGAQYLGIGEKSITRELVQLTHEADLEIWSWTVDDPERARQLVQWGIDGIISNRPRLMRDSKAVVPSP